MWVNPMLSIWLYLGLGALVVQGIILWKFYGPEDYDEE